MPPRNGVILPGHTRGYYLSRTHSAERSTWGNLRRAATHRPADTTLCFAWLCTALAEFSAFRARTKHHPRTIVNFCYEHTTLIFAAPRDGHWHVYPIDDESRHLVG